jgi:hypothetical protein
MRKFLGFQVANEFGENIQGDSDDPTGYASFEVLSPDVAIKLAEQHNLLLMPIYEDMIQEYSIIGTEL